MTSFRRLATRCAGRGRSYTTLLLAEHDNATLNKATLHAVAAAKKLPGATKLDLLVLGKGCVGVANEAATLDGVDRVLLAESDQLEHGLPDIVSSFLCGMQKQNNYGAIAGVSGSMCRETLPRMAAKLDVQPVTDVIGVGDEDGVYTRPMYAGNAIATVKSNDSLKVLTFRPTAFDPVGIGGTAPVESVTTETYESAGIEFKSVSAAASDKPQLSSASRVVSGGRALKGVEGFKDVLEPLCDKLGAAMGASRAAVDAGMCPNELQVGQTGKVVAPELYIAVGISGAIQHLAGMKDSKTIVAINKDGDAPIFQVADYGLVGDLFVEVPKLTAKV